MKIDYVLRRARPILQDAADILLVERQSLGDSDYTPEEAVRVLQRPEHHAYLARKEEQPVGFLSCLQTLTDRAPRLEIDMLGVCPEHRGLGLATSLIRRAIEEADERGTHRFRGVVAVENAASRAAFARAGLQTAAEPVSLLVYEILGHEPVSFLPPGWTWCVQEGSHPWLASCPPESCCLLDEHGQVVSEATYLEVHTLSYHGLWIEELLAEPRTIGIALRGLIEHAKALHMDLVGHLAQQPAQSDDHAWLRQGFRNLGPYLVFTMG